MKKIIAFLLATLMAAAFAACGKPAEGGAGDSAPQPESGSAAEVESAAESAPAKISALAANDKLPELDGYTKTEAQGMIMYTGTDNSIIMVQRSEASEEDIKPFESRDQASVDQINKELTSLLESAMPGATADGSFVNVHGVDLFKISIDAKDAEASVLPEGGSAYLYAIPGEKELVVVISIAQSGNDIIKDMDKIVESLVKG